MCVVLQVSRSGYYSWQSRSESKQSQRRKSVKSDIREVHQEKHKQNFGSPRVHKELKKKGILCSEKRVAKVMKDAGIQARTTKKFKVTTDSNHNHPVAENVLNREFDKATKPNELWVSDVTYIWTLEGWLYLTCVIDLFSRKVVGWSMASSMTKEFVMEALHMAVTQRCPSEDQFYITPIAAASIAATTIKTCWKRTESRCSMSRKGNCWEATEVAERIARKKTVGGSQQMESFFATLKKELVSSRTIQNTSSSSS